MLFFLRARLWVGDELRDLSYLVSFTVADSFPARLKRAANDA